MSRPLATVLIPTHAHAACLPFALRSVARQTVQDYELFVVGDGTDDATRAVVEAAVAADRRIRFFDRPKGARHGEAHRHKALRRARGRVVCYLGDDDMWLPDHLERMAELLEVVEFGHSLHTDVTPEGAIRFRPGDLSDPRLVEALRDADPPINCIGMSCAGHRMSAYKALRQGWAPAPEGIWTDLNMWRKFLAAPDLRFGTCRRPTTLHFASPARAGWTDEERTAELARWERRIADGSIGRLIEQALLPELARIGTDAVVHLAAAAPPRGAADTRG